MAISIIFILIGFVAAVSLIVRLFIWFFGLFEPRKIVNTGSELEVIQQLRERKFRYDWTQHSHAFKQHTIKHMIEVVEIRIFDKQKARVKIPWPNNEEELEKLQVMYDRTIDKYT